jgi:hypothetical protein
VRGSAVLACLGFVLSAAVGAHAQSWDDLEGRRAVVAGIDVHVTDVFDLTRPDDNTWIGRTANALHVQTRRRVVTRELLFAVGDVVDAARIRETERNLRRYSFVRDARIVPARVADRQVWVRVDVADAWSLNGSLTLRREGGATTYGADVDESNLAGRGKRLSVGYGRDRERSTRSVAYADPQWFGSRWTAALRYAELSDGRSRSAVIERPYYSIETPYSAGGFIGNTTYTQTGYHLGQPVYAIPVSQSSSAIFGSRAIVLRDRTAVRFGAAYQDVRDAFGPAALLAPSPLSPPSAPDRRLRGFSGTWAVVQDRPATFENFAAMARTEDYDLGWTLSGGAGYFASALGSTVSAPFASAGARKGWRIPAGGLMLAGVSAAGRHEHDGWHAGGAQMVVTTYARPLPWQTLAVQAQAAATVRPDPDGWLYLDSRAGLRGYPDHFLAGDRRVSLAAEDRVITPWRILGLVQAGFVAYADAGAIRRFDTGHWSRLYANVGAGLRFGSLKGAHGNILEASLAFPLVREPGMDRVQLVLGNSVGFCRSNPQVRPSVPDRCSSSFR